MLNNKFPQIFQVDLEAHVRWQERLRERGFELSDVVSLLATADGIRVTLRRA